MAPLAYRTLIVTLVHREVPPADRKARPLRYWSLQIADSGDGPPYTFANLDVDADRAWPEDDLWDQCSPFLWATARPRFLQVLNDLGAGGWRLASFTPPTSGTNEARLWPMGVHTFVREP